MKIRESKVSKAIAKLFIFSMLMIVVLSVYYVLNLPGENYYSVNDQMFLFKLLSGVVTWAVISFIFLESMTITRDYENELKWKKKDLQWMDEYIRKHEAMLKLPENELRRLIEEAATINIRISNDSYQGKVSIKLIPFEAIKALLEKSRDELIRKHQEKAGPKEPRVYKFWKNILSPFLEKIPEPQNG